VSSDNEKLTKDTLLIIYIPSYKRAAALSKQLNAISNQLKSFPKWPIEVMINDNASTENYKQIRELCAAKGFHYCRNPGNVGGNANIALGFTKAPLDSYLWILSDNDILKDTAIGLILGTIAKDSPDIICATKNIQALGNQTLESAEGLSAIKNGIGLISCGIYSMRAISNWTCNAFTYHNSSFPHLAVLLTTLKHKRRLAISYIRYDEVIDHENNEGGSPGDYSLSYCGMPLLAELLGRTQQKIFLRNWIREHWFHHFRNRYKHVHVGDAAMWAYARAGIPEFSLYMALWLTYKMAKPLWIARRMLKPWLD
jgi:glycosyltransferase involved in cell wall biosynthesis